METDTVVERRNHRRARESVCERRGFGGDGEVFRGARRPSQHSPLPLWHDGPMCWVTGGRLSGSFAMPPDHSFFVAQLLDVTRISMTCKESWMQVVAAAAALYTCTKLHSTHRNDWIPLSACTNRASSFLFP